MAFNLDANLLRTISSLGAGLGSGKTYAQAAGEAAIENIRNKMFQRAVARQTQRERDLRMQAIEALKGGTLLSPKGDMRGADSITFNGDGTYKIIGGAPEKTGKAISEGKETLTDKPLEGIRRLPRRESVQQTLSQDERQSIGELSPEILQALLPTQEVTAQSLAGLSPEDIINLMGMQRQTGTARTGAIQDLLTRKTAAETARREEERYLEELRRSAEAARVKRSQQLEDIRLRQKGKIELEREKARLEREAKEAPTEVERETAKARLDFLKQKTATSKALEEQRRKKEEATPVEKVQAASDFMFDPKNTYEAKVLEAENINNDPSIPVMFFPAPEKSPWFGFNTPESMNAIRVPSGVVKHPMPINPDTGNPVTIEEIHETAEAEGMTIAEVLFAIGVFTR